MHSDSQSDIKRKLLSLSDPSRELRKKTLQALIQLFSNPANSFLQDPFLARNILSEHLKALLNLLSDQADLTRQNSAKFIRILIQRSAEFKDLLPYIFSVATERLNCYDMEGVLSLPEVMRPPPGQKPKVIVKLVEKVQQVRMEFCFLIETILKLIDIDTLTANIDALVDMIRALLMDPFTDIQKKACQTLTLFCKQGGQMLLNFTEPLARAVLLPLVSKKSKIRIAALQALNSVLDCGVWKKNAFIMEILVGFRDPNSIAIKQFYEPSSNYNYLATLIIDSNQSVRLAFLKSLDKWVCELPDKYDHHARLLPYVLSGLIDESQQIKKIAFECLEEIGRQTQIQKQKQFRQQKQYGIKPWWLEKQQFLQGRPSLGSRHFVRGHVRKIWTALYRELRDIKDQNRLRAAQLILLGIIYSQEYIVQYLDNLLPNLITAFSTSSPKVQDVVRDCLRHIGRYCNLTAYSHIIKSAFGSEYVSDQSFLRGSFVCITMLLEWSQLQTGTVQLLKIIIPEISSRNALEALELFKTFSKALDSQPQHRQFIEGSQVALWHLAASAFYQHFIFKNLLLSLHLTEELAQSIAKSFQAHEWAKLVRHCLNKGFINIDHNFSVCFGDTQWKSQVSLWVLSVLQSDSEQIQRLNIQFQKAILETQVPQLVDQIVKLVLILQKRVRAVGHGRLLVAALTFINKFQVLKPMTAIQRLEKPPGPSLPYAFAISIFGYILRAVNKLHKQAKLSVQQISGFVGQSIELLNARFKRDFEAISLIVKGQWSIVQRKQYAISAKQLTFKGESLLPKWIDFSLGVIQQSGDKVEPQIVNMCFQILKKIFSSFPEVRDLTKIGILLAHHYNDIPQLLRKLFVYTLAQKNLQMKEKFISLLKLLCNKLRDWFLLEQRQAQEQRMLQRKRLLDQLLAF